MAVYTRLTDSALRRHLKPFRIGELVSAKGVSAGTINTIYDVNTTQGHYILRILENRSPIDARFEEILLHHLAKRGLTVPRMVEAGKQGYVIPITPHQQLSVFRYLPGREVGVFEITPDHVRQVGDFLAAMHIAGEGLGRRRRNRFAPEVIRRMLDKCVRAARTDEHRAHLAVLQSTVMDFRWARQLPRGIVHGDLFIDNVRFSCGTLCGVLDFEMACSAPFAYDVAVAIGDWAFLHDRFMPERARALLRGYQERRPFRPVEREMLFDLCCFSAARFATTRFHDFEVMTRPDAQRLYKDYRHFMARLNAFQALGKAKFDELLASTAVRSSA